MHKIVVRGGISNTKRTLITLFELYIKMCLEGHIDDQVNILSLVELHWELMVVRQVDDFFVVDANSDNL